MATNQPAVLVLASGRGERFIASGGKGSKLNAPLCGKTVLSHTLDAVKASGLPWHLEATGHVGMGDSIAAAVRATPEAPGWLVLPGDLPLIRPETLRAVAAALEEGVAVVLPSHHGVLGHPVGFAAACGKALMALHGPQGAQSVVRAQGGPPLVRLLDLDDPGIVTDIDTMQDLQAAQQAMEARRA